MGRHFPGSEELRNFEDWKSREIAQNTGKIRQFQTNVICYL